MMNFTSAGERNPVSESSVNNCHLKYKQLLSDKKQTRVVKGEGMLTHTSMESALQSIHPPVFHRSSGVSHRASNGHYYNLEPA